MDAKEYAAIDAMNWSSLKHMATSPLMMQWRRAHPRPDSAALRIGRGIHCGLLEPERWARDFAAMPDFGDLRFKEAKQARAAWLVSIGASEIELVDAEEYELITRCVAAVREHPAAARLLDLCRKEEIATWTDVATGIECKGRFDAIAPRYLLDLKSTRQQTLRGMQRDIASLLYHGQLAWYHDGAIAARLMPADAEGPFAVLVQTVEPYDVVPMRVTRDVLDRGRSLYRSLLVRYRDCRATDWWPGISPGILDLDLPPWAESGDGAEVEEGAW